MTSVSRPTPFSEIGLISLSLGLGFADVGSLSHLPGPTNATFPRLVRRVVA